LSVPQEEVDRRVSALSSALRENGLKLTHQRLEVIREIAGTEEHPDVETVFRGVRVRVPTISLDTVYRTLAVLVTHGLVVRSTGTTGPARYDANTANHHHFICAQCGLVRDVDSMELDGLRAPEATAELGRVDSVQVQLRGLCRACQVTASGGTSPAGEQGEGS